MILIASALLALGQSYFIEVDIPSGNDYANPHVEFVIPGFPEGLGDLQRVEVSITTKADLDAAVENLTAGPCCAFAGWDLCNSPPILTPHNWVALKLWTRDHEGTPASILAEHTTVCEDKSVDLGPFDGGADFRGASGKHIKQEDTSTDPIAAIITGEVPLTMWRRVELTLAYERVAYLGSGSSCGGAVYHSDTAKARGKMRFTFFYR